MDHALNSPRAVALTPDAGDAPIRHLYAHIPFCPIKCDYCAFVTHIGSVKLIGRYIAALKTEALSHVAGGRDGPLETVYLGGGTPSMLSPHQVSDLLTTFRDGFGLAAGAEITMEAHPATIDDAKLDGYLRAGVNRISFGVESVFSGELQALGRAAGGSAPSQALGQARRAGFHNIAADLMYGIPLQTSGSWAQTLERILTCEPDHLSLYPLSIEPKTVFQRRWNRHELTLPDDDHVIEMYAIACRALSDAGYQHYEVGSWCRDGHACRHNLAYWHNLEYFGFGVGAHGYVRSQRTVNVRHTLRYINRLESGEDPIEETEPIDSDTRRTETIMLRLRLLSEGLEIAQCTGDRHGDVHRQHDDALAMLAEAGLIRVEGGRIYVVESAVPVANEIWQRLAV